ncbi:HAD family hydrolase [Pigmentiphaga aceris]|uniref:Histidinol-phosphatase n=1 Tax=Pigmentiphaga aceris TaxID=1940612 RepID=A0A5C0B5C3_9BURK|nr:HAD family hydrolase [Pigmentiphaga aceris]QEI08061.1 HAD family hydrolase [Pigmentiphaga aceris]
MSAFPFDARRIALFDLDHTLLPLDSDYQWAEFLADTGRAGDREAALARNVELMHRYNAGNLTADESAAFMLGLLARSAPADLAVWHEDYMRDVIRPAIRPEARQLVDRHLADGDLVAIVTATNTFVTAPIARAFGVQYLLGTDAEYLNGRYTGRIHGTPCFREGKVTRVTAWLASQGRSLADYEQSWFYSDSMNDVPLLEAVTHPVATNPSPALRALSQARGWAVTDLFE